MHDFRQAHNSYPLSEFAQDFLRLDLLTAISRRWIGRVVYARKGFVPIKDEVRRKKANESAAFLQLSRKLDCSRYVDKRSFSWMRFAVGQLRTARAKKSGRVTVL